MPPKPKHKPKPNLPELLPAKKPVNHRLESLKSFVTEEQYNTVKNEINTLLHGGLALTLRRIWAVVDHLVSVCDGVEDEVKYNADTKKIPVKRP